MRENLRLENYRNIKHIFFLLYFLPEANFPLTSGPDLPSIGGRTSSKTDAAIQSFLELNKFSKGLGGVPRELTYLICL